MTVRQEDIVNIGYEFNCGQGVDGAFYVRRYDDEIAIWDVEDAVILQEQLGKFIKSKQVAK